MSRIDDSVGGGFRMDETNAISRNKTRADASGGAVGAVGAIGSSRDPSEVEYYNRKPPPPPETYKAGGHNVSSYQIENAVKNKDGTVSVGKVTLSEKDFNEARRQQRLEKAWYREAYETWHKEGWERGYIAGSPNERGMPRR